MRRTPCWALALALCAAPAAAAQAGESPAPAAAPAEGPEAGAFRFLRDHRAELGITGEQAARLRAIAQRLRQTNQPLRQELRRRRADFLAHRRDELMRMTPPQRRAELARVRAGGGRVPEDWRPLLERMRENQRGAMREVQAVLTPAQKQRARALYRQWRQERGADGSPGTGRP